MPGLESLLPADAAAWLGARIKGEDTIRIDGPAGAGKTTMLAAFVETVGDDFDQLAALAEDREPLPYLGDKARHLTFIVPAIQVRGGLGDLTHLLMRQMIAVVVADDPPKETWTVLEDLRLAGCRVWATSRSSARQGLRADVYIRLGLDPEHRVETVTVAGRPVYWVSEGEIVFKPNRD